MFSIGKPAKEIRETVKQMKATADEMRAKVNCKGQNKNSEVCAAIKRLEMAAKSLHQAAKDMDGPSAEDEELDKETTEVHNYAIIQRVEG